jgi:uncharacterized repeat protein (TIGR03803 family)
MTRLSAWNMTGIIVVLCSATAMSAQTFTTLVNFDGTNGANPAYGSLVQGTDGNLYGTTENGGASNGGTVFRLSQTGELTNLYSFCALAKCADGLQPYAGLTLATDGNLYGTTRGGGNGFGGVGYGTFFRITREGILTTLYSFCSHVNNCPEGGDPSGTLVQAVDGSFYGTTYAYGANNWGAVFKISTNGVVTPLHDFSFEEGGDPWGGLVQGTDMNLYGTGNAGGAGGCGGDGCGIVFKITRTGKITTIVNFDGFDGGNPLAAMTLGLDGSFYGSTWDDGPNGNGTLFKVTSTGVMTLLHDFLNGDGAFPSGTLVQATDGNFYGTTQYGGAYVFGTIFRITPDGTLTTLHSFDQADGRYVEGGLVQATNGTFYGTTTSGGTGHGSACSVDSCGTVFSLDIGLEPFVAFVRDSGKVGQTGGILGQGFTGTTSVSLNGTPANFTVVSDTFIKATVPPGATTGFVTVVTPSGTLSSNVPFRVLQ